MKHEEEFKRLVFIMLSDCKNRQQAFNKGMKLTDIITRAVIDTTMSLDKTDQEAKENET